MSSHGEVQQNQITVSAIHTNTELTLIQITEDKLRLVLIEHLNALESKRRWHVPLGVLLALVPVFLTSDFKDVWSIEKTTWKAFFMFTSLGATCWLGYTIRWAFGSVTLDELVQRIKNIARSEYRKN